MTTMWRYTLPATDEIYRQVVSDGNRRRRRYKALAASVCVAVVAVAMPLVLRRDTQPGRVVTFASDTASTTTTAPPSTSTTASPTTTVQPTALDLHAVDWSNVAVPGEACLTSGQIQLHDTGGANGRDSGTALIPDEERGTPEPPGDGSGPKYDRIDSLVVSYGDIDGDGRDEALLALMCGNNGGTADGVFLYSLELYSGATGTLQPVSLITPQQQPADVLPTLLSDPGISVGRIVVQETWYGPTDYTCCPSGTATTTWTYSAGQLHAQATNITAQPNS
jgi:hypothetical protein